MSIPPSAAPAERLRPTGARERGRRRPMGLRAHLVGLSLAILVPALAVGGGAAWLTVGGLRDAAEGRLRDTARALALAVDAQVDVAATAAVTLSESHDLQATGSLEAFEDQARAVGRALGSGVLAFGPGPDFLQVVNTTMPPGRVPTQPSAPELVRTMAEVARTNGAVVSNLYRGTLSGDPVAAVGVPVGKDAVVRTLAVPLSPDLLARVLAAQQLGGGDLATLTDAAGTVVASSREQGRALGLRAPDLEPLQRGGGGVAMARGISLDGVESLYAVAPLSRASGWSLTVGMPLAAIDDAWMEPLALLAFGGAAVLALGLLAAGLLARRIVAPIGPIAQRARRIAEGAPARDEEAVTGAVAVAELADLARSVSEAEDVLIRRAEAEAAAGAALAERNRALAELRDTLDLGAAMVRGLDGTIRFWSRGCQQIYGWTPAEAIGRQAHGLLSTEFPVPEAQIAASLESFGEWSGDLAQRTRDGYRVVVAARMSLRRDSDGKPVSVLESLVDATAQRQVEAALATSEARFRGLAEALPAFVFVASPEGALTYANARMAQYAGVGADQLLGDGWLSLAHAGDRERVEEAWLRSVSSGVPFGVDCRLRRTDGSWRWFLVRGEPECDAANGVQRWTCTCTDVDDLRATEAALAANEARLRSVVDTAADGIVVADVAGRIVSANNAALAMFGYVDQAGLVGRDLGTLMPAAVAEGHGAHLAAHRGGGDGQPTRARALGVPGRELVAVRRDGTEFPIEASVGSFVSGGQRFFTGVVRDVTERKRADDMRELLAREVDHRAKNALAVALSLLRLTPRDDAARFAASVEGRVAAMARAHSLLAQGRWYGADMGRLAQGELAAHLGRFDLSGPGAVVAPEAVQPLAMVLHELATNAAKHGALGSAGGRVLITWDFGAEGGGLRILWREIGGPVPNRPQGRRGFGSRLVGNLIGQQLGGALAMEWLPEGLSCTLSMPPRSAAPSGPAAALPAEVGPIADGGECAEPAPGRAPRVLVVEDEALLAMEMEGVLRDGGFEVVGPARSLADAARLATSGGTIDIAVLDANLGGGEMSFPVADLLRERGVPYVLSTGYGSVTSLEGRERDAAAVLTKPYPGGSLVSTLRAALSMRRGEAA